jgi:hypothetical protein
MPMTIERTHLDDVDFCDIAEGTDLMPPVTPGEILREDFLEPFGLSANALAKALHVPPNRITAILNGNGCGSFETTPCDQGSGG